MDAARNANGKVILYANTVTSSMERAISETYRRREIQHQHNLKHNIIPKTVYKEIKDSIVITKEVKEQFDKVDLDFFNKLSVIEKKELIAKLEKEMKEASNRYDFEEAMILRDIIFELKVELEKR